MHHLKAKPKCAAIRSVQAATVVSRISTQLAEAGPGTTVIVSGDFNADFDEECVTTIRERLSLQHAYGAGQLPWSTWKFREASSFDSGGEKKHTIDFILHDSSLKPAAVWQSPADSLVAANGLPCETYGSDHIAIGAVFAW